VKRLARVAVTALFVASTSAPARVRADVTLPPPAARSTLVDPKPAPKVDPSDGVKPWSAARPSDREVSTPRRAYLAFSKAAEANDLPRAAEWLDLRALPRGKDVREASELAAMLHRILHTRVALDPEDLPDEPSPSGVGVEGVVIDKIEVENASHVIALVPVKLASGETRWQFSRATVQSIRPVYEATQHRVLEESVPGWMKGRTWAFLQLWQWLGMIVALLFSYGLGRVLGGVLIRLAGKVAEAASEGFGGTVRSLGRPARLALATLGFQALSPYLLLPAQLSQLIARATAILYVVAAAWAATLLVRLATTTWEERLPDDTAGQLEHRGLRTRLTMIRRIATILIVLVASGVILLQFEVVRNVGLSLLASAGIAGVLVGVAAQRSLSGVIAGIELSITQPIRIGDVVVFRPGEMGTVEHIFFTYVVVRLWDDRRLVVPVSRVMSEPFENWTRSGTDLLAPVDLVVDYAAPVGLLRARFEELCKANALWDGRSAIVSVVDVTDRVMTLRGVASVDVATKAWPLRCELREGWITFLQELERGRYLPVGRIESREGRKPESRVESSGPNESSERR
jgi:small-conductance mechanosensitive channel